MLLGLIKCGTGLSQKIFEIYDLDSKKIISSIEDLIKTSGGSMTLGHLPLTRRAERILRNSFKESMKLDASYADDEHLLLAILSESDGIAIEILRSLSFDYDTVKDLVCTNNSNLIDRIKNYISKENNITLEIIDNYNLNGDYIESQAFAFLAIRSFLNLPISFSTTTGCKEFTVGGKLAENF